MIVPVGLEPPDRTAESEIELPAVTGPEAVVVTAGPALLTRVEVSFASLHAGVRAELLFASPL